MKVEKTDTPTKADDKPQAAPNPFGDVLMKAFAEALKADPAMAERLGLAVKPATPEDRIAKLEADNAELRKSLAELPEQINDTIVKALGGKPAAPRKGVTRAVPVSKSDDIAKVDGADPDPDEDDNAYDNPMDNHIAKALKGARMVGVPLLA